jgi:general secretion pathway protein D
VIVAKNTRENRTQFQRMPMETVYLPGLNEKELTEVSNVAKNVFEAQQSLVEPTAGTLTIRAPAKTLAAFNNTMSLLENGRSQVALNVKVIQLAHVSMRETGATFFQQTGVFNVFSEINSVLSQNQSLVQQIIASGLVPNQSTLANQIEILAILVASGQLTGTPFNQGFLPFGGGLTQSILSPGPATLTMSMNSSDTRTLDDIQLQLEDQEEGTFKIGERYPIETSSYSSVALPASLTGLTGAATAAAQTIPQIDYQDIGLTFKATPKVMRSNEVALNVDLKIQSLGGNSLNDIPILNSQQVTGVLTLKAGETAVLLSDLSRSESRALNGLPGVSDIPGLQDISDIQKNQNVARLLVLITPTVVRNMQPSGHSPMLMVDKAH